ncbi:Aldo/keto reductase [Phlegmacium glaucopus]|nr:Aldo/keto reductase [Phlegmacium glaucopus]
MPFYDKELNDGNKIPSIAYGTGSVNKGRDIHEYIELALDAGFSHIDTAKGYGNERGVAIAIRESGLDRSDLFITTKYEGGSVADGIRTSLNKLEIKYLDLYLIHWPAYTENGDFERTWREFERCKQEGLTKSIGVSNFNIEELQKLLKIAHIKPAVNQIHLHPYSHAAHASLLDYHSKHGIVTEAYGSLASITSFPGGPVDVPVEKAAQRLGISPTQVIFLWVKAKGAVIVTTSSSKQHLEEYFATGDLPPLTEEEVAAIDAAGAKGPPGRTIWTAMYAAANRLFRIVGVDYQRHLKATEDIYPLQPEIAVMMQ